MYYFQWITDTITMSPYCSHKSHISGHIPCVAAPSGALDTAKGLCRLKSVKSILLSRNFSNFLLKELMDDASSISWSNWFHLLTTRSLKKWWRKSLSVRCLANLVWPCVRPSSLISKNESTGTDRNALIILKTSRLRYLSNRTSKPAFLWLNTESRVSYCVVHHYQLQ